ncbi:MAG TPA: hypothetical protein VML01_08995, partial [Bryobacterales bacterium]|nr:hypothetical protein [Bryobacterales bacterium]
ARLWRHPRVSREALLDFQNRKLRLLIAHAYANVPFYRRRFDEAGVHPDEIQTAADLARLPVVTKAELRNQPLSGIVDRGVDPRRLTVRYTTGSSGESALVRRSAFEDLVLNCFRVRALKLLGRRVSDRIAKVGSSGVSTDTNPGQLIKVPKNLGLYHYRWIDALRAPSEVARDLARFEPDVVQGYPGVIAEVAALWSRGVFRGRSPRMVCAGGEVMTPAMRHRIAQGMQTRAFNIYGCHEFNMLGWECPASRLMHICDDNVIIEVLRDGRPARPGESGEVFVTGLHIYSAPYIRYSLGDIVTLGPPTCSCGLPFSTIQDIRGRVMDYCTLPNGRRMHHWELIPMTFWEMPWHRRYQMVQQTATRFVLRLVHESPPPAADIEHLETRIREKLGPGTTFQIEYADDLAFGPGGKNQLCRSELGENRSSLDSEQ